MNRRQFLTLGLTLPFVPQITASPQFQDEAGLTFPVTFAESGIIERKPGNTTNVQVANFRSESLITKLWHWLQTIK